MLYINNNTNTNQPTQPTQPICQQAKRTSVIIPVFLLKMHGKTRRLVDDDACWMTVNRQSNHPHPRLPLEPPEPPNLPVTPSSPMMARHRLNHRHHRLADALTRCGAFGFRLVGHGLQEERNYSHERLAMASCDSSSATFASKLSVRE